MPRPPDPPRPPVRCRTCNDLGTVWTDLPGHPSAHRVPCPACQEPPAAATVDQVNISTDESASRCYALRTLGPYAFVEYLAERRAQMYGQQIADSLAVFDR